MTIIEWVYLSAGVLLPLFYVPQMVRCLRDETGLGSYSLRKAGVQLMLRILMMPFILSFSDLTMTVVVSLDLLGRATELLAAITSLRAQGFGWQLIARRLSPVRVPSAASTAANFATNAISLNAYAPKDKP